MDDIASQLERQLSEAFSPERLDIINESHLHAGHQPDFDGTGQTHFRVRIVAEAFAGMNRVTRHRKINEFVTPLMDQGLHAIAIEAKAPGE